MTQNQIAYQRLQEDKRHNKEEESIGYQRNRFGLLGAGISAATNFIGSTLKASTGLLK